MDPDHQPDLKNRIEKLLKDKSELNSMLYNSMKECFKLKKDNAQLKAQITELRKQAQDNQYKYKSKFTV